jgi:hypothetical protein
MITNEGKKMQRTGGFALVTGLVMSVAASVPLALAQGSGEQPGSGKPPSSPSGATYGFAAAPHLNINRIYRVNREDGEVTACQFEQGGSVGTTKCFQSGEGAGPQPTGDYGLMASHMQNEAGIFRVNRKTGEVSNCYVLGDTTVCTPPAK